MLHNSKAEIFHHEAFVLGFPLAKIALCDQ